MIARVARLVGVALATAVLMVSGPYVLVYLARWEWNRAIVSALVFLSMLVILSTALILQRFRALDVRLDAIERIGSAEVRTTLREANDDAASRHFEWLERPPDSTAVFVPVLLGTGVVLSMVAYVIERVAGLVAGATLDRRTAAVLPMDLPLSGAPPVPATRRRPTPPRRGRNVVAVVLAVGLTVVGVDAIRRLTQSRPGELSGPGVTTIEMHVERMDPWLTAPVAAETLWIACRERLPGRVELSVTGTDDPDEAVLTIDRALGHTGRLRIVGCLEDFTIARVLADVTAVQVDHSPSPESAGAAMPG